MSDKSKPRWLDLEGVAISIGGVEIDNLDEPMGPTPMPGIFDLREWDMTLMRRYKPFYAPVCDGCCLCTYGRCDLSGGKKGACGIDIRTQQARIVLIACCMGATAHGSHGQHLVHHLIHEHGADHPIDMGKGVNVESPLIRLICGYKPETLGDLQRALDWGHQQVTDCLASSHTGQEGNYLDYESKALHISMVDEVFMEIADIAQISGFDQFPKAEPDVDLIDIGLGTIDKSKPMILVVGHNVVSGSTIYDYMEARGLEDDIEVGGICCTAIDITRRSSKAKIVGSMGAQLRFVRSGIPDVVIVDEQCVRTDLYEHAKEIGAGFMATNPMIVKGLPDRTGDTVEDIIEDMATGRVPGVLIREPAKVGEIAVRAAQKLFPIRKNRAIEIKDLNYYQERCTQCRSCRRACPEDLPLDEAMKSVVSDPSILASLWEACIGCGRCLAVCPNDIPVMDVLNKVGREKAATEIGKIRAGRGAVSDVEIRDVGAPIVLGEIPGIIAIVGCPNYPNGKEELGILAQEFAERNYIVVLTGCGAMDVSFVKDEDGKNLYERFEGGFNAGSMINIGSCVSNSHIVDAAIKVASIYARRSLKGNYEEIADYILNRVGAVGVAWGAMSQKAASIATGVNRIGVPVIVGPHGWKYRRLYLGDAEDDESWQIYNARDGSKVYVGPTPGYLLYVAETIEEAIVMTAQMCMRPNDTNKGRAVKLAHYCDLSKKYLGMLPNDLHQFIRNEKDIPLNLRDEVMPLLEEKGWKEVPIPDPTLLPRLIRKKK
ncbi:MAG: CO dehydrogenase/acetyl-CoA synthase complex subunit alpha, partial [Candidatus Hodarchaeota archaeon]